jgi:hypothetical protein
MENQEKKLKCKMSTFKTDLTFNEWVQKYNVSYGYVEPTKYFQGNPSSGFIPLSEEKKEPLMKRIGYVLEGFVNSIPLPFID